MENKAGTHLIAIDGKYVDVIRRGHFHRNWFIRWNQIDWHGWIDDRLTIGRVHLIKILVRCHRGGHHRRCDGRYLHLHVGTVSRTHCFHRRCGRLHLKHGLKLVHRSCGRLKWICGRRWWLCQMNNLRLLTTFDRALNDRYSHRYTATLHVEILAKRFVTDFRQNFNVVR